jgi:hypothetical protein
MGLAEGALGSAKIVPGQNLKSKSRMFGTELTRGECVMIHSRRRDIAFAVYRAPKPMLPAVLPVCRADGSQPEKLKNCPRYATSGS